MTISRRTLLTGTAMTAIATVVAPLVPIFRSLGNVGFGTADPRQILTLSKPAPINLRAWALGLNDYAPEEIQREIAKRLWLDSAA